MEYLSLDLLPLLFLYLSVILLLRLWWAHDFRHGPFFLFMILYLCARSCFFLARDWYIVNILYAWFPLVQLLAAQESLWYTAPWKGGLTERKSRAAVYLFCWSVGLFTSAHALFTYEFRFFLQLTIAMSLATNLSLLLIIGRYWMTAEEFVYDQAFLLLYCVACLLPALVSGWYEVTALVSAIQLVSLAGWHWNLGVAQTPAAPSLPSRYGAPRL